jgi:hypothetical protein
MCLLRGTNWLLKYIHVSLGLQMVRLDNWRSKVVNIPETSSGFRHSDPTTGRSQWRCGLRRGSAAAWLLGLGVRISLRARIFVSYVCCVLCRLRPLRRINHSFRRFLLCVCVRVCVCVCVCVRARASNCVWSRNLKSEAAYTRVWLLRHRQIKSNYRCQHKQHSQARVPRRTHSGHI